MFLLFRCLWIVTDAIVFHVASAGDGLVQNHNDDRILPVKVRNVSNKHIMLFRKRNRFVRMLRIIEVSFLFAYYRA